MIKTGIVGFGISAKVFHAPFIQASPLFELVSVLERTKSESTTLYPDVRIVRSITEMVSDPTLDLIVITTPNETHFPYARMALEAGKNVVLEKPFANDSTEAAELVEIAGKSGKVLSVYQNRRYVSDYLTIREILAGRLLGDIHEFEAHYDRYRAEQRPQAWREKPMPGSGILYDLGAHLIDQAFTLFGIPKAIAADIRLQRPHAQVDDNFELRLDYGFLKVILKAGMLVREPGPRYMIHGTKGSFIKYGEDVQEAKLRNGEKPVGENWGAEPAEIHGLLHTEKDGNIIREIYPSRSGHYGEYYNSVYNSIVNGAPVTEKPEHGLNTIRLIELAMESSEKKCMIPCTGLIDAYHLP
ncbi:MAG: oxidoreductase [Chitinophagaceae bacterium]|nr:MAG: oxidoreductase [Chitinophagaceae bacterium]